MNKKRMRSGREAQSQACLPVIPTGGWLKQVKDQKKISEGGAIMRVGHAKVHDRLRIGKEHESGKHSPARSKDCFTQVKRGHAAGEGQERVEQPGSQNIATKSP